MNKYVSIHIFNNADVEICQSTLASFSTQRFYLLREYNCNSS